MKLDYDRKLWKGIADEAGLNAVFHPQTRILRSWLPVGDQPPAEHPCLEVAGALAFLYVDPQLRALRLSLHLDDVIRSLQRENGETIPLRVMVNDTVIYDDTTDGAQRLKWLLAPVLDPEVPEAPVNYLRTWAEGVIADTDISHTATRAAARALVVLDERLSSHGRLPSAWCKPRPRPAEQPVPKWSDLDPDEAEQLTMWFDGTDLGQRLLGAAADDRDFALWLAEANRQHEDGTGTSLTVLNDNTFWLVCFREGWTPAEALVNASDAKVVISDGSMICPKCGVTDSIREEDWAVRWNTLHVVESGLVFGGLGDGHFEHLRFVCSNCHRRVELPGDVEDYS